MGGKSGMRVTQSEIGEADWQRSLGKQPPTPAKTWTRIEGMDFPARRILGAWVIDCVTINPNVIMTIMEVGNSPGPVEA